MTQAVMMTATLLAHSEQQQRQQQQQQQQQHVVVPEMHASWRVESESCVCIECTKDQNAVFNTVMQTPALCDDDNQGCPVMTRCQIHAYGNGIPVMWKLDFPVSKLCTGCSYSTDAPFCSACCRKNLTADSGYA